MISLIVGTRPNFMKVAPVRRALEARGVPLRLVHTGQHFDENMSAVFFRDLGIPAPDVDLHVGGGSHAEQTAAALVRLERDFVEHRPDAVVVVGDVTSTFAAALAAAKLGVRVVHVEAGLRSRDWTMPEEINRVLTDRLSDLLLIPSHDASANLVAEGIDSARIVFVGNVMIDSLRWALERPANVLEQLGLTPGGYAVVTLHRPANVDSEAGLRSVLDVLDVLSERLPTVFPIHPRTAKQVERLGLGSRLRGSSRLKVIEPMGYAGFATLVARSAFVATDSGGIQEETTALGIPCLTMRGGTERPITVTQGTNIIVGLDAERARTEADRILAGHGKRGSVPEGWDGHAGERCADAIVALLGGSPPPLAEGPKA